jgi:hypothetical protein
VLFSLLQREVFHILFWHVCPSHHFNVRRGFDHCPSDLCWTNRPAACVVVNAPAAFKVCWTARPATCVVVNASVAFEIGLTFNFALPWWLTYWHHSPFSWRCFIVVVNVSALLRPLSLCFVVSLGCHSQACWYYAHFAMIIMFSYPCSMLYGAQVGIFDRRTFHALCSTMVRNVQCRCKLSSDLI